MDSDIFEYWEWGPEPRLVIWPISLALLWAGLTFLVIHSVVVSAVLVLPFLFWGWQFWRRFAGLTSVNSIVAVRYQQGWLVRCGGRWHRVTADQRRWVSSWLIVQRFRGPAGCYDLIVTPAQMGRERFSRLSYWLLSRQDTGDGRASVRN